MSSDILLILLIKNRVGFRVSSCGGIQGCFETRNWALLSLSSLPFVSLMVKGFAFPRSWELRAVSPLPLVHKANQS